MTHILLTIGPRSKPRPHILNAADIVEVFDYEPPEFAPPGDASDLYRNFKIGEMHYFIRGPVYCAYAGSEIRITTDDYDAAWKAWLVENDQQLRAGWSEVHCNFTKILLRDGRVVHAHETIGTVAVRLGCAS